MAKKPTPPNDAGKQFQEFTRDYVVRDERLLGPVFVDHSMITISTDTVIHSLFQTQIPVKGLDASASSVEAVLVARYVYPKDYFRALAGMFVRQVTEIEHRSGETGFIEWLEAWLKKQKQRTGKRPRTNGNDTGV